MKYLKEAERKQRAELFLSGVSAVYSCMNHDAGKKEQRGMGALSPASLSVLTKVALEPLFSLSQVYKALGLHPAEGKRAVNDLEARNYVRLHRMPRKGRGGQPVIVEVLPLGADELKERGFALAQRRIKRGGFRHDWWGRQLELWARQFRYPYWFERTLGKKAFDFVYDKDGKLYGIEISLSGSLALNASQAIKAAEVPGLAAVTIARERKPFLEQVLKEVKTLDQLGLYTNKLQGKLLTEYYADQ
jgi:DNA-binding MarR family transcriptional regulator